MRVLTLLLLLAAPPVLVVAEPLPLVIDLAQSRVEVVVKATIDSFTGKLSTYKADIIVDDGHVTAATFRFRFADVCTGKDGRDEVMRAWQETPRHPEGVFTLRSLAATATEEKLLVRGELTLHGVTREIEFPASITTDRVLYAIDGQAPLDTRDFGLPVIRKFGLLKVNPVVTVCFHLQGAVAAAGAK